ITKRMACWTHASAPRRGEQSTTVDCESFLPGAPNNKGHLQVAFFVWQVGQHRDAASCRIDIHELARTIVGK
ncbi:MAG: hypothetical protein Q7L07_04430, partial [Pseudohongiella sp.]|nr:hypothetical protein [Pseudohongiella sp.]